MGGKLFLKIKTLMTEVCEYEIGDVLIYTATEYPYKVKVVDRKIVQNDKDHFPKLPEFKVGYGCERLGRIDYLTACEHELEKV